MSADPGEVTRLLAEAGGGGAEALDRLVPLIHEELRTLAASQLRRERRDHTLQATALVNEAYLRLVEQDRAGWRDRQHFFAIAATAMRRVLVNHARDRRARKRGGERGRVPLDEGLAVAGDGVRVDLVALDDALEDLAAESPDLARVVEMRYFAGMSNDEIAAALGLDARTVKRRWRTARLVLFDRLGGEGDDTVPPPG